MEVMFPSAPTNSITVVTVTQSRCETPSEQDRELMLHKASGGMCVFQCLKLVIINELKRQLTGFLLPAVCQRG